MRLVIDTNIFISALFDGNSLPAQLIDLWRRGHVDVLTSEEQIDEIMRVTRYAKIREKLTPALAGRLINQLRDLAIMIDSVPDIDVCADPYDNYLLAIAEAGAADCLVTGDERDLLPLKKYGETRIMTVRDFLVVNNRLK